MPVLGALRTEAPRPRVVREHRHAGWLAATTVCAGAFLLRCDAGVVVFSLPALRRHFGVSPAAVQWVSLGPLLTMVAAAPPVARLAGAVGHKLTWTYGFVVVAAASAACGLAPSLGVLIAFREVQAVGAAMVQAGGLALMSAGVVPGRPGAATGVLRAAPLLGLVAGPVAGGLVIASAGWRWVFLAGVPAGCAGAVAGRCLLPRTRAVRLIAEPDPAGRGPVASATPRHGRGAPLSGIVAGRFALFAPLVLLPGLCAAGGVPPAVAGLVTAALPGGFVLAALLGPAHRTGDRLRGVVAAAGCLAVTAGIAADPVPGAVNAVLLAALGVLLGTLVIARNAVPPPSTERARPGAAGEPGMALAVATVTLTGSLGDGPAGARLALAALGLAVLVLAAPVAVRTWRGGGPATPIPAPERPPDARFLLANERTFLAWNRTALALVAAGLAVAQLLRPFPGVPWGRPALAVPLILLGAVIAVIGHLELSRNRRALYRSEPLPRSVLPKVLTFAVGAIAVISATVLVLSAARGR
ncbi:MFS transporter [Actinoallomurus sp. NBC_01490]|uniref:MFS transporter n=1 Tax=Actinoallomurus sp. NBC_01490 TaxID=2903557 RepID=UPI002E366A7D|nr:MFS transporter [Actinoallomurus sp. NBC_01490]